MAVAFRAQDWANTNSFPGSVVATPPRPAGTTTGDLLLVFVHLEKVGVVITPPAGWTSLQQQEQTGGGTNFRMAMFWRMDNGAAGPYTFSWDATSTWWFAETAVYSGTDAATPINASAIAASASSTTVLRGPTVTTNQPNTRLVIFGSNKTGLATTPPAGFTERLDTGNGYCADIAQAGAGATGNEDATLSSAAWNIGALIAVNGVISRAVSRRRARTTPSSASSGAVYP